MRRARAHRAFAHRACARCVHVLLQLLLSIEPKLAFCMTMDDRTTSRLDAAMTERLIKYTNTWRFDKEHWLLVSLTSSERGLAILANENDAQKVANYAEALYARTPLARVEPGRQPW